MERLVIPAFLTDGVEDTPSLYHAVALASDSDEISCTTYDCSDKACTCNATYSPVCTCNSQCKDCSDCTDVPAPPEGMITSVTSTATTVTMVYASISGAASYEIAYRRTDVTGTAIYVDNGKRLSYTIEGLDPDTSYTVNYRGVSSSGNAGPFTTGREIKTKRAFTRFDWTYAGLDLSTGRPIRGDEKEAGLGVCVTADEWNELVDLVNEVKGTSIDHVSRGAIISAAVVNKVANALGVTRVYSDDPITADFFNRLRSAYNSLG